MMVHSPEAIKDYAKRFKVYPKGSGDLLTPNPAHTTGFTHRRWENKQYAHKYVFVWNEYSVSYNFTKQWWETYHEPYGEERTFVSGEHKHIFDAFDSAYEHKSSQKINSCKKVAKAA